MDLANLQLIWWLLVGVLFTVYVILDGFDLGVGLLHLFARNDEERDLHVAAIGPFWDGNEVWLITAGGALFAAFPVAYATTFSAFYLALTLVLFALIARAIGLEFRSQVKSALWMRFWDGVFGLGSAAMLLLLGVAFANIMRGLAIEKQGSGYVYVGTFLELLNPYALMVGLLCLVYFAMHGALWLAMKTEDRLQRRLARWAYGCWCSSVGIYLVVTVLTFDVAPHLMWNAVKSGFLFWPLVGLLMVALGLIPVLIRAKRFGFAFLSSSAAIVGMLGLAGLGLFPMLAPSSIDLAGASLTLENASAKASNLTVMLIIAGIGMPLVVVYHVVAYWLFRGPVSAEDAYGAHSG